MRYVIKHNYYDVFLSSSIYYTVRDLQSAKIYQRKPNSMLRRWQNPGYNSSPISTVDGQPVYRKDFIAQPVMVVMT